MRRAKSGDPHVAVGYLRVSTDDQAGGLETQRMHLCGYADSHGLTLAAVHLDEGVSGATPIDRRPGLLGALGAVQDFRAGVLLAIRRDRLGRDPLILVTLEAECRRLGARIATVDGVSDGDDAGAELLRHMVDGVSRYERRLIAGRVRDGMARVRAQGRTTGVPPLGYQVAEDGALALRESEAAAVARALALAAEGSTVRTIAATLDLEGFPARGARWHPTSVQRMIQRARVHGAPAPCTDPPSAP